MRKKVRTNFADKGGRSAGIIRSQTRATEFGLVYGGEVSASFKMVCLLWSGVLMIKVGLSSETLVPIYQPTRRQISEDKK
jgi:hypothetical protein